jgi:hypothetical protein
MQRRFGFLMIYAISAAGGIWGGIWIFDQLTR